MEEEGREEDNWIIEEDVRPLDERSTSIKLGVILERRGDWEGGGVRGRGPCNVFCRPISVPLTTLLRQPPPYPQAGDYSVSLLPYLRSSRYSCSVPCPPPRMP